MSPFDNPNSFFWEMVTQVDSKGHIVATKRKPAFIAKHKIDPSSNVEGWVVAVRKFTITIPPPQLPQ